MVCEEVVASPATCRSRLYHWWTWTFRASFAILDQGLIASSNFVIGILLARWLVPQEYGSYALAFAIFLLLSLLYQSLVLEPQRVFGPTDHANAERQYLGVLIWGHLGLASVIFVGLGLATFAAHLFSHTKTLQAALAGVTFAAPCMLLLWLARGAFYVRMKPQYAVNGAAIYCAVSQLRCGPSTNISCCRPSQLFLQWVWWRRLAALPFSYGSGRS